MSYYALDLERRELERTLNELSDTIGPQLTGKMEASALWGTFDDGIKFIREGGLMTGGKELSAGHAEATTSAWPPLHILFLGTTLGNFTRSEAVEFLKSLPLRAGQGDTLLLGASPSLSTGALVSSLASASYRTGPPE